MRKVGDIVQVGFCNFVIICGGIVEIIFDVIKLKIIFDIIKLKKVVCSEGSGK